VTLTVDVAANASTPLLNFTSVAGGGELNTANDRASDSTVIIQLPDLFPTQSHPILVEGMTGANYMLNVNNATSGTTSGTLTVTDTLPAALTATAMSGPGWNCTLGTLTCTRSDTLGPFGSYPAITLTVNVANNASSVTNTVTVSGGGEIFTSNDTSSDTTQVNPAISIFVVTGTMAVHAGSPVNFMFFVDAPLPSATNFSCSGLPAGAACTFNPSSVSGESGVTVIMTITTSSGLASASPLLLFPPRPLYAILLPLLGVVGIGTRRRRGGRKSLWLVVSLVGLAFALSLAGCGGGGPPPPPPRTPAGTYTITVTGNNPTVNAQANATVTLTVQ